MRRASFRTTLFQEIFIFWRENEIISLKKLKSREKIGSQTSPKSFYFCPFFIRRVCFKNTGIRVGVKGNSRDRETPLGAWDLPATAPLRLPAPWGRVPSGPRDSPHRPTGPAAHVRDRQVWVWPWVGDPSPQAPRENRVPLFTRSPLQKLGITSLLPN